MATIKTSKGKRRLPAPKASTKVKTKIIFRDREGGDTKIEPLSITENGTYTAPTGTAYSPVNVNVSGGGGITKLYAWGDANNTGYTLTENPELIDFLYINGEHKPIYSVTDGKISVQAGTYLDRNPDNDIKFYNPKTDNKYRAYREQSLGFIVYSNKVEPIAVNDTVVVKENGQPITSNDDLNNLGKMGVIEVTSDGIRIQGTYIMPAVYVRDESKDYIA